MRNSLYTLLVLSFSYIIQKQAAAIDNGNHDRKSPRPGHSNFFRSDYISGRQQWKPTWCAHNESICKDPARFPSGATKCCWNRFCVDTRTDSSNCGGCNKACSYGYNCCGAKCVDLLRDRKHCGSCGNACSQHSQCEYGLCGYASWEKKKKKPRKAPKHPW